MRQSVKILTMALAISLVTIASLAAERELQFDERLYDFGHVGIDFKVFHQFIIYNQGSRPYRIDSIHVNCECSNVKFTDSVLQPGDTTFFNLSFSTKNYFGPVTRSFTIYTDYPALGQHIFNYTANVGQWINGIRPDPISLFFLPAHKSRKLSIRNGGKNDIELVETRPFDRSFEVEILSSEASPGESLELKISPAKDLTSGNYWSSLSLGIKVDSDSLMVLSIPIKIVKY